MHLVTKISSMSGSASFKKKREKVGRKQQNHNKNNKKKPRLSRSIFCKVRLIYRRQIRQIMDDPKNNSLSSTFDLSVFDRTYFEGFLGNQQVVHSVAMLQLGRQTRRPLRFLFLLLCFVLFSHVILNEGVLISSSVGEISSSDLLFYNVWLLSLPFSTPENVLYKRLRNQLPDPYASLSGWDLMRYSWVETVLMRVVWMGTVLVRLSGWDLMRYGRVGTVLVRLSRWELSCWELSGWELAW